jgi:hypothetical protein
MKLSPDSRFPYPVLSPDTSDYQNALFEFNLEYEEDFQRGILTLACVPAVQCDSIEELIARNIVGISLVVACRDTYYREIHDLDDTKRLVLELDRFFGRVEITPLLITRSPVAKYMSKDLSNEYQQPITFGVGDLVGYASTMFITVGRLKLENFDSIFQLSEAPSLLHGEVAVDVDDEKIQIQVSAVTKKMIDELRVNATGQRALLSSVYLPAVMEVLSILAIDSGAGSGKRWREVFTAKCDLLSINPAKCDLLRDAQRLLRFPVPVSLAAISAEGMQ